MPMSPVPMGPPRTPSPTPRNSDEDWNVPENKTNLKQNRKRKFEVSLISKSEANSNDHKILEISIILHYCFYSKPGVNPRKKKSPTNHRNL